MTPRHQHGFSLVELMVAMTVTLIVSAAIYGLLSSGSNAFRREPELADRQQNIRVAMDLIARDVFNAGAGLPTFSQVFTISDLSGSCTTTLNGCGVPGTLGAAAAAARAPGDGSDPSENTDVLELVATDEQCPFQSVCTTDPPGITPGAAGLFVTRETVSRCMRLPGFALLTDNSSFVIQPAQAGSATAATICPGGSATQNGNLALGVLPEAFRVPAAPLPAPNPVPRSPGSIYLYQGRVVRYRIGPGLDPAEASTPCLWRSETGRYAATGVIAPEPGDAGFPGASSSWELVARGIEDLQIEYMAGDLAWRNQPPVSTSNQWNSMVRQVRITLSARASAANLAGETNAGGGAPRAVRGQLSTTVTPRAAFNELQMGAQIR
jgi:prepilin-type N-terminal cleavage/methylation domain-containing protein